MLISPAPYTTFYTLCPSPNSSLPRSKNLSLNAASSTITCTSTVLSAGYESSGAQVPATPFKATAHSLPRCELRHRLLAPPVISLLHLPSRCQQASEKGRTVSALCLSLHDLRELARPLCCERRHRPSTGQGMAMSQHHLHH